MDVRLYSYRYSVYSRIARMVLHVKQVPHEIVEVDPFADLPDAYLARHPFGRVPVLGHGAFSVYETGAITRYVDRSFGGLSLQPADPAALASMDQVIAIIDSYGYVPLVRQVFSHSVFRPLMGVESDPELVKTGLDGSRRVLAALEEVSQAGKVLTGRDLTLSDCHLVPMIDYFLCAEAGQKMFADFPCLSRWWEWMSTHAVMGATDPDLSRLKR